MRRRWPSKHRNSIYKLIKRSRRAEAGHISANSHARGKGEMYKSLYQVMKIKTVKPEKAAGIENSIINAARNGMLKNRVSEAELVSLLEKDSEARGEQKITVTDC
jgi:hypothetical protein